MAQLLHTVRVGDVLVDPDYVFSRSRGRLKGGPYRMAKKYLYERDVRPNGGHVVCEIGGEEVLGAWEVHHRGRLNEHVARLLGIACRTHNAGGHDTRSGSGIPVERASEGARPNSKETEIALEFWPWWRKQVEDAILKNGSCSDRWAVYGLSGVYKDLHGYGSSKTTAPYVQEMVAAGIWELKDHLITFGKKWEGNEK